MLILNECCLKHIAYEILDKIPTENDWDYPVPFVRIDKKDKRAWILIDNKDAKGVWIPFGTGQAGIEKIITSCGDIIPISGVIEFIKGDGILFECDGNKLKIGLEIPILAKYGGTGYVEYNLGDLLVGNIEGELNKIQKGENGQVLSVKEDGSLGYIDVLKKCNAEEVTENALARWDADGKCLKNSKSIQDDLGNTETTSTVDGELKQLIENLSSSDSAAVVQHLRSLVKTMIRQEIKDKQIWDNYIDTTSKSYVVRGQNLEDPTQTGNFFEITTKGDCLRPMQLRALAILEKTTGTVAGDGNDYYLGSTVPWRILKNVRNCLYGGGGTKETPLKYTPDVTGTILMKYQFSYQSSIVSLRAEGGTHVYTLGRDYFTRANHTGVTGTDSNRDVIGFDTEAGKDVLISWKMISERPARNYLRIIGSPYPTIQTAIFFYLLG